MHQLGLAFTSMSQTNKDIIYAGIDIAKQTLAMDWPGGRCQFPNDARGQGRVVKFLGMIFLRKRGQGFYSLFSC
jgi:hypothetical protein